MTDENQILSHPARVRLVPNDRQVLLQQARLMVGEELPDEDIFVFRAEISNDLLDSHFTHMAESTLTNYNTDAIAGVAFLRGHNWRELPIGYSMDSLLEDVSGRKRVVTDFYTVRGLPDTNDLIHRLKTRLVRDVSVGFGGGTMRCDICEQDFWECRHWPGLKYEVKDGDVIREVVATYTIEDARLSEVSGVFDGSTPQAMILKAERFAAQGLITPDEAYKLERQYRVNLPLSRSFAVGEVPTPKPKGKERKMNEQQFARLKEIAINSGLVPEGEREALDEETTLVVVDKMVRRIQTLTPLADDGKAYREALVTEALEQGVRLNGNDFAKESYESLLRTAPLETVKRMRDDWKALADKSLPTGRHSTDGDEERPVEEVELIPDEAYR